MLQDDPLFTPPRPRPLPAVASLIRTIAQGDGDLLSLLPAEAYTMGAGELGFSRRSIKLFNDPALVREIMFDADEIFPKSDLMVGALEPLIGDSIFVSDGDKWRRQRSMIDPAFSLMRLSNAYGAMAAAVDTAEAQLETYAEEGRVFSLDLAMSRLAADIICRTVFSIPLASETASEVFDAFEIFERDVAQVKIHRLILDPAWTRATQSPRVLEACAVIRDRLGALVDTHRGDEGAQYNDIGRAVVEEQDGETGEGFTREELIDQLGVFFLAGHETTASALTWAFYALAVEPRARARLRAEVDATAGDAPLTFDHVKQLGFVRQVFRETLRLYPPITFMPRIALAPAQIGRYKVRRGALVMISPWTVHRHKKYWSAPDAFDPDRFSPERESEITPGAYMPFGLGPHTCVGAGFAAVESALILAQLMRRFDFEPVEPGRVRAAARLTTRPAEQIMCRVRRHAS